MRLPSRRNPGHAPHSSWGKLALEFLSIVFAVFFALGVNEWREARANRTLGRTALHAIQDELQRNARLVERMLPGHEAVLERMNEADDGAVIDADSLLFLPVILRTTAWRTATETQALLHIPYDTATAVAEIYTFQEAYAGLTESLMQAAFDIDVHDASRSEAQHQMMGFVASIFVQNERMLLDAYKEALTAIEAAL